MEIDRGKAGAFDSREERKVVLHLAHGRIRAEIQPVDGRTKMAVILDLVRVRRCARLDESVKDGTLSRGGSFGSSHRFVDVLRVWRDSDVFPPPLGWVVIDAMAAVTPIKPCLNGASEMGARWAVGVSFLDMSVQLALRFLLRPRLGDRKGTDSAPVPWLRLDARDLGVNLQITLLIRGVVSELLQGRGKGRVIGMLATPLHM